MTLRLALTLCAFWISLTVYRPLWALDSPASTLKFRLTAEPATLDWNLAHSSHETYIIMNIMEGLVEEGIDLKPHPALAERWETSADGKTLTFFLKQGVKWSDGKPLKASDFLDSWLRLLSPKTRSSYASFLFDVENAEAFHQGKIKSPTSVGVKALGDLKLQIKLRRPVPYFLHIPSFWVTFPIRTDLIAKYGSQWATPGKMAVLGPYLLEDWKKGRSLHLKKNPGYYRRESLSPGNAQEVEALVDSDDSHARQLFEQRKIDFLLDATTRDLIKAKSAANASGTRVEQFNYLATYYLGFHLASGPLKDVRVRKALALAIDRAGIPAALQGGESAATDWIPPGLEGHDPASALSGSLYDARGALTQAGYSEGQAFPKLSLWIENFDGAEALQTYLVHAFKEKLGIDVLPRLETSAKYQEANRSGKTDLFVGHWGADFPDPANFMDVFTSANEINATGWKNPDYDKLVADGGSSLDPTSRIQLYSAAEKLLLQKEVAVVPLFYRKNTVLIGPRVKDFQISPLNYLFLKLITLK